MDNSRKKAKTRVIISLVVCLGIAAVCFGGFAYNVLVKRHAADPGEYLAEISTILVFTGLFFLVMAFGYIVPGMVGRDKKFTVANMEHMMEQYIPRGESLLAGIFAVAKESDVTAVYGKCRCIEGKLLPDANGKTLALEKRKCSSYNIYIGITQSRLLIVECEKNKHAYSLESEPDVQETEVQNLQEELLWNDIGISFPLEDVQACETQKAGFGRIMCTIKMKNGDYFKLELPDNAGPFKGDMVHHVEYREMILTRLGGEIKR